MMKRNNLFHKDVIFNDNRAILSFIFTLDL